MRPAQEDILNKIEAVLTDDDIRYIIIEGQTGIGKSALAMTIAKYLGRSYILTASKALQEQYANEFGFDVASVKGKGNYRCGLNKSFSCANGPCLVNKRLKDSCAREGKCQYLNAFNDAISNRNFVTSYSLFLANHSDPTRIEHRDVIVFDECHCLDDILVNTIKLDINMDKLLTEFELAKIMTGKEPYLWRKPFKEDDVENNIDVLDFVSSMLKKKFDQNLERLNNRFNDVKAGDKPLEDLAFENESINDLLTKIKNYMTTFNNGNWASAVRDSGRTFIAIPISSQKVFQDVFEKKAHKMIFMSSTIFGKQNFCDELGIDAGKATYVYHQGNFDPDRSPIVLMPFVSFKDRNYQKSIADIKTDLDDILATFKKDKGIIHTANYKIANEIAKQIKTRRFTMKKSNESNEQLIEKHMRKNNSVLISPSLMNGIDLKDDLARFQVIMKLPFANISDPRMKYLSSNDFNKYFIKMFKELVQACGRSTRNEDDWSVTYILDSSILKFIYKCMNLSPTFRSRLVKYDEFDLNEFLKDKR